MTMSDAPKPRRMNRPRWLDARVIGGVLLLVASVVIGAKVIGASSKTSPVWAAAHHLSAGTVLRASDLVAAQVNLGPQAAGYLDAATPPVGRMLTRPVDGGELVPADAVGSIGDGRIVAVSVAPDRMPPGVGHGSVIDLYLTTGGAGLTGEDATTRLLQADITVQSVTAPASGGLSGATSSQYQVAILLAPSDADALVRALPTGVPLVVLRTALNGREPNSADAAPDAASGTDTDDPLSSAPASSTASPTVSGQGG